MNSKRTLAPCSLSSNCIFVEWLFEDIDKQFDFLIEIASALPRTILIKRDPNYWHGVCRSLIFRFPDDLEILKLKTTSNSGKIQIKSASRFGVSDLGVNGNRIRVLKKLLQKKNNNQV